MDKEVFLWLDKKGFPSIFGWLGRCRQHPDLDCCYGWFMGRQIQLFAHLMIQMFNYMTSEIDKATVDFKNYIVQTISINYLKFLSHLLNSCDTLSIKKVSPYLSCIIKRVQNQYLVIYNDMQTIKASDNSLFRKLNKTKRREQLIELENQFDSSGKIQQDYDYNALQDKHAYRYFTNSSAKKHLKRMIKVPSPQNRQQVINREPCTTKNNKIVQTINKMLLVGQSQSTILLKGKSNRTINQSECGISKESHMKTIQKTNLPTQEWGRRMKTVEYFDPYTHVLKPTTLEKINKLKIEVLNRKRKYYIDQQKKKLPSIRTQQSPLSEAKKTFEDKQTTSKVIQKSEDQTATQLAQKEVGHNELQAYINRKKKQLNNIATQSQRESSEGISYRYLMYKR